VAAVLLTAGLASAQMSPQEQFAKGQELFEKENFEEALPFFRNAFDRTKSPNASLYVARTLEKLGRLDEAYREMQATVTLATDLAKKEDKYADTRDAAAGELAQLKPRVALLVIAFTEELPDATVTVNDRELVPAELGVPFPVMPGAVAIVGRAPGRETVTKNEELAGGETKTIALALPESGAKDPSEDDDGEGFELTPLRIAGMGVAGLGVVGMVVFAVTGSMASSKFSEVEEGCGGVRCTDLAFADVIDEGKTLSTVANVSVAIGGAALIAGTLMIILGGPVDESDAVEEGDVTLWPSPGGIGVAVSF
jgi:hypothetical protein